MKKILVLMAALVFVLGMAVSASADFIDTTGATGEYYRYALFSSSTTAYKGGGDVDAYRDTIYVNRDGTNLDVYTVTVADTDGDGLYEPDQHPDNIGPDGILGTSDDAIGPMETRTLTYVKTYSVPGLKTPTTGELYATSDKVYYQDGSGISYVSLSDGLIHSTSITTGNYSHLGYDDVNDTWFASNEYPRTVYSWNGSSWVSEFSYSSLAGSHMDGLEVVTDPDSGIPYVYVSDMTSDYLGQWRYDTATSSWVEENLFSYNASGAGNVEGMGFGALAHFWATTGFSGYGDLYEIGGGELGGYTPTCQELGTCNVPEPSILLLLGSGLIGLAGFGRKRFFRKD